jgi:hypothetical protein
MWRFAFACLVACSGPGKPPVTTPPSTPPGEQHRATIRIDAEPGGKRFQGVWLDFGNDKKWVIAYRSSGLWRTFENQEVIVTGWCYSPEGQAISAQHFRVEKMRYFTPQRGRGPLLEIGPPQKLKGKFVAHQFPVGSKLEGESRVRFAAEDGTNYWIAGADANVPEPGGAPVRIRMRPVDPDLSYVAQPGGPNLWFLGIMLGSEDEPPPEGVTPCPGGS